MNEQDRLTLREEKMHCKAGCRVGKECCYAGCVNFQKVQNRLAEYEDTGFSPEEIVKLKNEYNAFLSIFPLTFTIKGERCGIHVK